MDGARKRDVRLLVNKLYCYDRKNRKDLGNDYGEFKIIKPHQQSFQSILSFNSLKSARWKYETSTESIVQIPSLSNHRSCVDTESSKVNKAKEEVVGVGVNLDEKKWV